MNDDDLIGDMAHRLDPQVFEHSGAVPPDNFFGSPEWWEVSKNSRRQRAIKDATAALRALDALGFAVVPRSATDAMALAGAARLAAHGAGDAASEQTARELWEAMRDAAKAGDAA